MVPSPPQSQRAVSAVDQAQARQGLLSSTNGGTSKGMVYVENPIKNPIKMDDDWGYHHFRNPPVVFFIKDLIRSVQFLFSRFVQFLFYIFFPLFVKDS